MLKLNLMRNINTLIKNNWNSKSMIQLKLNQVNIVTEVIGKLSLYGWFVCFFVLFLSFICFVFFKFHNYCSISENLRIKGSSALFTHVVYFSFFEYIRYCAQVISTGHQLST